MKNSILALIIVLSSLATVAEAAAPACRLTWLQQGHTVGIELIQSKQGCQLTTESPEDCFILKSIGLKEEEIGASVFRKSSPLDSYCLEGTDQDAFVSDSGIKAYIECHGKNRPKSIRLESPDKKYSKTCPFPFG